jgi:hypothetical protein
MERILSPDRDAVGAANVAAVRRYILRHPESRRMHSSWIIRTALVEAFPVLPMSLPVEDAERTDHWRAGICRKPFASRMRTEWMRWSGPKP